MGRIVGFGAERVELPPTATRAEIIERRKVMLARCLNMRTTVAFLGAGCSIALGYPSWDTLARGAVAAMRSALAEVGEAKYDAAAARLEQLGRRMGGPALSAEELLVIFGFCQRVSKTLGREGHGDPYGRFLSRTLSGEQVADRPFNERLNPYVALLHLPIRRFVTTNVDLELEHAIVNGSTEHERLLYGLKQGCPAAARLSFTQSDEYVEQLSGFVLALRDKPRMVFHCHGRYDEPESMVITENDYQKWYLREGMVGQAFRQNIHLLFGSNPIFFVGFSMHDSDLLHALRILNAGNSSQQEPRARSLFALLPASGDDAADLDRDDLLYERYRVHVIPYTPRVMSGGGSATSEELGPALCRTLMELRQQSLDIRRDFIDKPVIRKVVVPAHPPEPYLHYAVARRLDDDLAPARTAADLARLTSLLGKTSIVVVHGYGGSGKSWRVLDLIERVRRNSRAFDIEGIFFWSTYYADDWLTGLDRALAYFGSEPTPRRTRMQRFEDCLKGRHLIVFDGFERMLKDHGSAEGTPASRSVVQLLDAARNGKSTVVLTTRLMPNILKNDPRVVEFSMRRATTAELANGPVFRGFVEEGDLTSDDLAAVCSLCDGHSYALALAAAFLGEGGQQSIRDRMETLRRKLSDVSPARRLTTMIRMAVDDVTARAGERAKSLLERVAVFMSPLTDTMMEVCAAGEPWRSDLKVLLDASLLFSVSADPHTDDAPGGYTVHPLVRSFMFHHAASHESEAFPNFTLPGFTSGSAPLHPGSPETIRTVKSVFATMHGSAEQAFENGQHDRARELCRGAFGVVRSRMEANSVARWTTYDDYLEQFEIPLANLVKRVAPAKWDYMDRSYAPMREDTKGPLFADELAWLWNDIGLAFFGQGSMADALAVWELSYEIDRVTDSYEDGGQYLVQSRLHMTAAFLESGRLDVAGEYLANTEESNRTFSDDEYAGRILGYKALLAHLRGNTEEADRFYGEASEQLQRSGRNLRGRSIFAQHHADLKMLIGDLDGAANLIRTSTALAEEGRHLDLVGYARNSGGHLLRLRNRHRDAQLEYDAALAQARATGIRRLESDVLCELAHLALSLGDWETARSRAVASLMIANELWLGLRRSHGLVVLGKAMIAARNRRLGVAYLRHALALAKRQGYLLSAQEADRALRNLGEAVDDM